MKEKIVEIKKHYGVPYTAPYTIPYLAILWSATDTTGNSTLCLKTV
jgi:hypothetical protein